MESINAIFEQFSSMTPEQAAAHDAEIEKREAAEREREKVKRYHESGAPERYWAESLDTYNIKNDMQKTAAAAAVNFLHAVKAGDFKTLVFIGTAGTGKTHLACAIIREAGGLYRSAPDIVEEFRRAKSFSSRDTESDLIYKYGHCRLLVIDEIGRGINATDEKYMLYQLLNARYNTRRPSVLISNHNKADFLNYIGIAAADRLLESGAILEMNGDSYRRELRGK